MHRPDKRLEHMRQRMGGGTSTERIERTRERVEVPREIYSAIADLRQRLAAIETARTESPVIPSLDDINARLSALEHGIAAVDGSAVAAGGGAKRAEAAVQFLRNDVGSLQSRLDGMADIIGELRDRIGRMPSSSIEAGDGFDLPRMFGGQGGSPSSGGIASLEDRMEDIVRQINILNERFESVSDHTINATREAVERLARDLDVMRRRQADADRTLHDVVEATRPQPVPPPPQPTATSERTAALVAIREAAMRRRAPDLSGGGDSGTVALRLAELSFNARAGRIDAVAAMEQLGATIDAPWQEMAADIGARHDLLNALTAETLTLERQATGAINSPELATIEAIRAERDRWLARIKAATGGVDGSGQVDSSGS